MSMPYAAAVRKVLGSHPENSPFTPPFWAILTRQARVLLRASWASLVCSFVFTTSKGVVTAAAAAPAALPATALTVRVCMSMPAVLCEMWVWVSSQRLDGSSSVQYRPANGTSFARLAPTPRQRLLTCCVLVPCKEQHLPVKKCYQSCHSLTFCTKKSCPWGNCL